jgi:hypothetical protein
MDEKIKKILSNIKDSDLVLDIGGWTKPLARANYVLDYNSYETRGKMGHIGDGPEQFNKNTWIMHDICSRKPFPFKDKQFDFVFCSHTLEDVKDPAWVCSEIIRIGKRGYIETPSRWIESKKGVGGSLKFPQKLAGYFNHSWFVEVIDEELTFTTKNPLIHVIKNLQIKKVPSPILEFFWENNFKYREKLILSLNDAVHDLLDFKLKEINNEKTCQKLRKKAEKFLSLTFWQKIKLKLRKIFKK